ncbi:MAG TPA: septal ring lytic transglycosylase RlpA family protein [Solirubrobacteraceae bacterium]|nr:septal ring lytic transglycosylase RlpA family protein [Solirubrobacteraceae bacterium]
MAVGASALAIPGLALAAGSGGAGTGPGSGSGGSGNTPGAPPVSTGNAPVTATGNGITIASQESAFLRPGLSVSGAVPGSDAGETVEIDQLGSGINATWVPVATATAQSGGSFAATWRPSRAGQMTIRAVIKGTQASSATAAPTLSITVYRRSTATLYGPGFYGHRTACGQILRRRTIGVANRTLPCGTPVQIFYKGQVITVPVIDRGPYAHGANWDLTMATGRALGMLGTAVIGATAVPSTATTTTSAPPTAAPSAQ